MFLAIVGDRISLAPARSFAGLMTLYETSYLRLRRLLGDPALLAARSVSSAAADLPLHVEVLERAPYTTTLRMTYWFAAGTAPTADPDLVVRVYRDARLAEACSCAERPHHRALSAYARRGATELERRWLMNVMLSKWLEYCLDVGHRRPQPARAALACLTRVG
jgi:uncharacterized protein YqiB (DUF1249 family)